jgi:hypothetical protein
MKTRIILFVLALAAFTLTAIRYYGPANDTSSGIDNTTENAVTSINFPITIIETGSHKLMIPVKVSFVVYNTGSNDLYIQKVEPDCHCTVADFSKKPIPPKDSAYVILKYDAANPGPFQSSAIVTTNSQPAATLLVFRGMVR